MSEGASTWIKQNMLGVSPNKRTLSEAEKRVQQALQRLEIPEWYLNKNSKPPKILRNAAPIETRQSPWKRVIKSEVSSGNDVPDCSATTDPTGVYKNIKRFKISTNDSSPPGEQESYHTPEMSSNQDFFATYRICKDKQSEPNSLECMEVSDTRQLDSDQSETSTNYPRPMIAIHKSDTFPKMSPSRKIENINIVFPPIQDSRPEEILKSDINSNLDTEIDKMALTFDTTLGNVLSEEDRFKTLQRRTITPTSCFNTTLANAISPKPFCKKEGTPFMTPSAKFSIPAMSTPDGFQQSLYADALDKSMNFSTQTKIIRPAEETRFSLDSTKYTPLCSFAPTREKNLNSRKKVNPDHKKETYWLGEVKLLDSECNKVCKECGAKPPRIYAALSTSNSSNLNNLTDQQFISKKLKKVIKLSKSPSPISSTPSSENEQVRRSPSPDKKKFNTTKKLTEVESSVKVEPLETGNDLIREIVQELKNKCSINSKNAFTTPVTKHFVKRLVNDLKCEDISIDSEVQESEEEKIDDESGSDLETNSAALSTSISLSFKSSDFGCEFSPVTSTLKSKFGKSGLSRRPLFPPEVNNEVYWIPIKNVNFPKVNYNNSNILSPSISSISVSSDIHNLNETTTSGQQERSRKLLKIYEGGVLDSGYSDRSRSLGSDSSGSEKSFFNYSIIPQIGSEKSFRARTSNHKFRGKKTEKHLH